MYTVFLAGKPLDIRSYTLCIHGSGQPYTCVCKLLSVVVIPTQPGGRKTVYSC